MRKGDPAKPFNIDLSGIDKVLLLVEECGDGMMYDRADYFSILKDGTATHSLHNTACHV